MVKWSIFTLLAFSAGTNAAAAACGSDNYSAGFAHAEDLHFYDNSTVKVLSRVTYMNGFESSVRMDIFYIKNGKLIKTKENILIQCKKPFPVIESISASKQDQIAIIYTRSIDDKLNDLNFALSKSKVGELIMYSPLMSDVSILNKVKKGYKRYYATNFKSHNLKDYFSNRVGDVDAADGEIPIQPFSYTLMELGLGNPTKSNIAVDLVCLQSKEQVETPVTLDLQSKSYSRLKLNLKKPKLGIDLVHCYILDFYSKSSVVSRSGLNAPIKIATVK